MTETLLLVATPLPVWDIGPDPLAPLVGTPRVVAELSARIYDLELGDLVGPQYESWLDVQDPDEIAPDDEVAQLDALHAELIRLVEKWFGPEGKIREYPNEQVDGPPFTSFGWEGGHQSPNGSLLWNLNGRWFWLCGGSSYGDDPADEWPDACWIQESGITEVPIIGPTRRTALTDAQALDRLNLLLSAAEWPGASGMEDVAEIVRWTGRKEIANAPAWERH